MLDACIVTEGAWPHRTGGLASWAQYLLTALHGADVAVLSLGPARWTSGQFDLPRAARTVDVVPQITSVPMARRYFASGLVAAEQLLRARPDLAGRIAYVEHGDAVREVLYGASVTEGGRPVPPGSRWEIARDVAQRRRAIARLAEVVIGVTPSTTRRARRDGAARALWLPNAVPSLSATAAAPITSGRLGYVGRFSRIKGIDRFVALARSLRGSAVASGLSTGEHVPRVRDIEWRIGARDPWPRGLGVLAMPSRLEASPFAALEAEARGIPVLLSSVARLPSSRLIVRLPWCRGRWAARVTSMLREGTSPEHGARVAAARWRRFERDWRRAVSG